MPQSSLVLLHGKGGASKAAADAEKKPAKRKRERIQLIETQPKPDWFVKSKDEKGRTIWYLRMEVTGQLPRRYGPFENKHAALLFLDQALNELVDAQGEIESEAQARMWRPAFRHRWYPVVIEDELALQYRTNRTGHGVAKRDHARQKGR